MHLIVIFMWPVHICSQTVHIGVSLFIAIVMLFAPFFCHFVCSLNLANSMNQIPICVPAFATTPSDPFFMLTSYLIRFCIGRCWNETLFPDISYFFSYPVNIVRALKAAELLCSLSRTFAHCHTVRCLNAYIFCVACSVVCERGSANHAEVTEGETGALRRRVY